MMFEVRPDPRFPHGGHALLIVPEGSSTGTGRLTIRRPYDGRHLGAGGWQEAETAFGPLEVSDGAVALGPDIVGNIAEFERLEVSFEDGGRGSLVWPSTVLPPPDRARPGGLQASRVESGREEIPVVASGTRTVPERPQEPVAAPEPGSGGGNRGKLLVAFLVLVVAAIAAGLYIVRDDLSGLEGMVAEEPGGIACSDDAVLAAGDTEPGVRLEWVRRCGSAADVTPEMRLRVVEQLLAVSPDASVVMGRWYDPAHRAADASPFEQPAIEIAARYYAQAAEAGNEEARALLADVCSRLDPDMFMQHDAIVSHCP